MSPQVFAAMLLAAENVASGGRGVAIVDVGRPILTNEAGSKWAVRLEARIH